MFVAKVFVDRYDSWIITEDLKQNLHWNPRVHEHTNLVLELPYHLRANALAFKKTTLSLTQEKQNVNQKLSQILLITTPHTIPETVTNPPYNHTTRNLITAAELSNFSINSYCITVLPLSYNCLWLILPRYFRICPRADKLHFWPVFCMIQNLTYIYIWALTNSFWAVYLILAPANISSLFRWYRVDLGVWLIDSNFSL